MTHTFRSPAEELLAYGHAGTELHRVNERRSAERQRDAIAATRTSPGRVSIIRQWLGETLIDTGTRVAGTAAEAQQAGRRMMPKVDTV